MQVEVGCPCGGIRLHHLNRMFLGQPFRTPVDKLVLSVTTALGVYYSTGGADGSPTYGVQYGGHQHSQHAAPGDGSSQFAEESWSSSSDTSGEDEPDFSPVDEEDQAYAYKSKSRCNWGSASSATPQQNQLFSSHQCFLIIQAKRATEALCGEACFSVWCLLIYTDSCLSLQGRSVSK
ncbi:hypothetical protein AMECASPLE_037983 [Ameca splendens]|uniref:Uncharacterized protein n=1 Tax=Ameca splendens TaxID=208324 RepID=A0ABV1A522_9TELE